MEESAHVSIHYMHASIFLIVLGRLTLIKHDAEGEKVAIRAEKQVKINPGQGLEAVLINDEVDELDALENE